MVTRESSAIIEEFGPNRSWSTLLRIEDKDDIWIWGSMFARIQGLTAESVAELTQAGFKPLPGDPSKYEQQCLILHSQFRPFKLTIDEQDPEGGFYLAYPKDIEAIEKYPVLLTSSLTRAKDETLFRSNRIYPPKEHGTSGVVMNTEGWYYYKISDLPIAAQESQKRLSQKLEELEAKDKFVVLAEYEPVHLFNRDVEVQKMIQQLAQDYYKHHELLQTKGNLPHAINPFDNGMALASTSSVMQLFTYATQNAIAGATRWKRPKDHRPHFSHNGNIIEYGESDTVITDEAATSLWEQVKQQNYTVVDMATFAISLCARSLEPDHSAWVYASEFIKSRGLAKMKKAITDTLDREAGHQQKNQREAQQSIFHLEKLWMTINQDIDEQEYNPKTKKRKRHKFTYKGRFIVVKGVLTQKDLGTTDSNTSMEVAWHIAPGDWLAPFLQYPNRQIANLSDRILKYDPYRQKWEKSLGYYFFFNGHMNSKGRGCTFNRYIEPLLKECSLDGEIERNRPQRTRDRFEKAMNKLVDDRLINGWYYTDHKNGYIPSKRSWIDEWLGLKVAIDIAPEKDLLS
jgi:hypothetical protein